MTTFTENDIAQINQKLDRLTGTVSQVLINQESLKNDVTDLKIGQAKLEAKLEGKIDTINARFDAYKPALDKIPDLAEKVGELKNWRQFTFTLVASFLTGVIGWFLRGVKF